MTSGSNFDSMRSTFSHFAGFLEVMLITVIYYLIWSMTLRGVKFLATMPHYYGNGKYVLCLVYALIAFVLIKLCDGFEFGYNSLSDVMIAQFVAIFLTDFITYFQLSLIANKMIPVKVILLLFLVDIAISFVCCILITRLYRKFNNPKNMVLIYGKDSALDLKFKIDTRKDTYNITSTISIDQPIEKIVEEIKTHDAVIINDIPAKWRNDVLKYCYANGIRMYIVPKISDIIVRGAPDITMFDTPLTVVESGGIPPFAALIKRVMDIILCLIALIPLLIITVFVAIAIKLDDGGPVFYRQKRVTKGGKEFEIIKFRSMKVNAEEYGTFKGAEGDDPRITKVGKRIRATRIDELPQIFNILKGDMSIVGPRPEHKQNTDKYMSEIPEFSYRLKVKAGLTGYAQIYGKYNTSAYDKLRLDLMYIENYSLLLDFKLILRTVGVLFKKESTEGFETQEMYEELREEILRNEND